MRNRDELADDVNARYVNNARARTSSNGQPVQRVFDASELAKSDTVTFWRRLFPSPEVLDVAGRQVTGFVVPHWAAGVILAAMITSMGFMYSRLSDQRDMLIRLDTQLQERDKREVEFRLERKNSDDLQELKIQDLKDKLLVINSRRGK